MLDKEALVVLTTLSQLIVEKLEEPISHGCGWVNSHIVIAVARSYSRKIRKDLIPSTMWYQDPYWDSVLGLGMTQQMMCQNNFAHTLVPILSPPTSPRPPSLSTYFLRAVIVYGTETVYGELNSYDTNRVDDQKKDISIKIRCFGI